ncbi:carboxymethylenebutenolidase [Streptosporangium becharense]|uniref:Carboxymethylenebutenolidase n=1 Tax=Streptosporangium becharense TaxID=1816182 RepID=A0A7W9MJG3_9ACTN|nr:dienelactone hydrolase family protein [Streptosporangium becharense]MBB2910454.1 carboxymethylenebutenolidase [Streptosporangium becharense]MBB5823197.1 carboxymethylenebutenolidase [Streptosporangium becharense]
MTGFHRYLVEEIATDHADGLISRREALRRLSLLGMALPAAGALLSACGAGRESAAASGTTSPAAASGTPPGTVTGGVPPPGPSPLPTEEIIFPGPEEGVTLQGAWVAASNPRGAVLVIHENRGLNDHIRSVAGRLAADGYSALALDLLSREGGTGSFGDTAKVTAALGGIPQERFAADMKTALGELERRVPGAKLGAVGFCFGGGMTWLLVASDEPRLAAAVPFYGPLPDGADFSGSEAAVLGVYAERDDRVNATRDEARAALERAGLEYEIVTFPGADHAFFNDTGPRYDAGAAAQAYRRVIDWFGRHLS